MNPDSIKNLTAGGAYTVDDGGPAYPCEIGAGCVDNMHQTGPSTAMQYGMTMRDHFAGLAMQGYLASMRPTDNPAESLGAISECAYMVADAMLAARKASHEHP